MRDHALFAVAPYVAALVCVTVCAVRCVLWRRRPDRDATPPTRRQGGAGVAWRVALGVLAVGHLLALLFPDYVLLWDRRLFRLVVLEGFGVVAGSVGVAGVFAALVRPVRAGEHGGARSPVAVVAATLLLVGMMSGVGIAVFYRWASSWSEVTLVPYLYSLVRLQPTTNLVTHLPVLVKLHVVSAIAVLAAFPFTATARVVLAPIDWMTHWTLATASRVFQPAWFAIERWTSARAQTASAMVRRNGEEEN